MARTTSQNRQDQTGGKETSCQNSGGAGQQIGRAAPGHETAATATAANPQATALRALQQHGPDEGHSNKQMNDEDNLDHDTLTAGYTAIGLRDRQAVDM